MVLDFPHPNAIVLTYYSYTVLPDTGTVFRDLQRMKKQQSEVFISFIAGSSVAMLTSYDNEFKTSKSENYCICLMSLNVEKK